jgi:leader peptidase (prepilin peptidase) / N-methyltransferase
MPGRLVAARRYGPDRADNSRVMWSWPVAVAAAAGLAGGAAARSAARGYLAAAGARPVPPLAAEVAGAALFAVLAAAVRPAAVLAAACWFAACAIALAVTDAVTRRLPDRLTGAAYAGVAACLVLAAAVSGHWDQLGRAGAGGAALAGFFLLLALAGRGAAGLGDAKLAASAGTALAWFGWVPLAAGAAAGFVLAAAYGAVLLALRRATLSQHIAYGPFLAAGALAAIIAAGAGRIGG